MLKYFFITISFLGGILQSNSQTCILVVARNDTVTISADCKIAQTVSIFSNNAIIDSTIVDTACKIRILKNCYYAAAGRQVAAIFKNLESDVNKYSTIDSALDIFCQRMPALLTQKVKDIKRDDIDNYNRNYKALFCEASIVKFEKGKPVLCNIRFINKESQTGDISVSVNYSEEKRISPYVKAVLLGHISAVEKQFMRGSRFWDNKSIPDGSKQLILKQIADTPESVGLPISILQITKSGPKWIENGCCN